MTNKRRTKKKTKGKKRATRSSESSFSSDDSEDERMIKRSIARVQIETLARTRLVEARPKKEEEKYGDDGRVDYKAMKNKFMKTTKVKGINYVDVLSEMPEWFRGAPRRMVDAFQGAEDAKKVVEDA